MATHAYYVPPVNLMGRGCLQEAGQMIRTDGYPQGAGCK